MPREKILFRGIDLMVTTDCNMNCKDCYGHHDHEPVKYMDLSMGIKATRFAADNSLNMENGRPSFTVVFFGGEPLLNWDFITDYISWIENEKSNNVFSASLGLCTNGLLLNPERIEFFQEHGVQIFLSLDGGYERHIIRRPSSRAQYDHLLSAVDYMVSHGYAENLATNCVVQKQSVGKITELIEFFYGLGIRQMQFHRDTHEISTPEEQEIIGASVMNALLVHKDLKIIINPELVMNCDTCVPSYAMIYPGGDIFDFCYLCGPALCRTGRLTKEELEIFHLGNILKNRSVFMDVEAKRKLMLERVLCPMVGGSFIGSNK